MQLSPSCRLHDSVFGSAFTELAQAFLHGTELLGVLATTASNPLGGRNAYTGRNLAYPALENVVVNLGTAYAGQRVRFRFVVATDLAAGGSGWEVDDIAVDGITNTPFPGIVPQRMDCASAGAGAVPADRVFRNGFD